MVDLTSPSEVITRPGGKPKSSAIKIYGRLVGYAWNYKGRLLISLLFASIVALSLISLLMSVGVALELTYYTPAPSGTEADAEINAQKADPALFYAGKIKEKTASMREAIGWAPTDLDEKFLAQVKTMRSNHTQAIIKICTLLLIIVAIMGIARFIQEYFAGAIGANISADLGTAMFKNIVQQPLGFFEMRQSGDILGRFANDIFMVNRGLAGVFVKLMREPLKAAGLLIFALSIDWKLTCIVLGVLPPLAFALTKFGKKVRKSVRRSLQKIASMTSVVNETISGMPIIIGFNMESYEAERMDREVTKLRRFLKKMVKADAATGPTIEFILTLGIVAFLILAAWRVEQDKLSVYQLLTLFGSIAFMLDPVRKLSSVNNMIQQSVASAERVFEFIDMKPGIVEAPDAKAIAPLQRQLAFEKVHFAYDGKTEVLKGIDLTVNKGEMVALVGFSGAGKSTIVKLIPRFYDIQQGAITIDGTDIRQATFESLREQLSIVTQDTILFAESIRDNIAFGSPDFTDAQVEAAAKAAHAHEFIVKLPKGYDTVIGESGSTLSGGQRQRLAIARAIIKDPAILILDEATSSLDSESERHIQAALNKFVTGRTSIVIAHRLSTIQRADRIVVLEDGYVAEQGTHEELLAHGGIYRRLYDTQFGTQEKS